MLADLQEAFARLCVDPQLRSRHREAPAEIAAAVPDLALSPSEVDTLRSLDPVALERFARSLIAKRRRAVEATVPGCVRMWPRLGDHYERVLAEHAATSAHLQPLLTPGQSELLRTFDLLARAALDDPDLPPWFPELLSLELARACSWQDRRARLLRARHPVHLALAALDEGWLAIELEPEPWRYLTDARGLHLRPAREEP